MLVPPAPQHFPAPRQGAGAKPHPESTRHIDQGENEMTSSGTKDVSAIGKLLSETYPSFVMDHDAAGYADLYANDVLWAPPNGPDQTSKEGVKNGIQGLFDKFAFKVDVQPEEIEVLGSFAYVIGSVDGVLSPRDGGVPVTIRFRVFWLLRREAAGWKISRQIWNKKPVGD